MGKKCSIRYSAREYLSLETEPEGYQLFKLKLVVSRQDLYLEPLPVLFVPVRWAAQHCGLKEVGENDKWTVLWTDNMVTLDRLRTMKRFQKINHFPGMMELCRKDLLARNLNRTLQLFPEKYNVFPRTCCLPAEWHGTAPRGRRDTGRGRLLACSFWAPEPNP
ncbi:hypothetical protein DUI87_28951 [Hirundo rustica rustica]|uniref:Uncharacterized protein n=1 Tax=Hirundo rustica rustica TaxID=333673 RepID=A0A3M0JHB0_HIRRU|nr:hypothetical protein DUI87_28951 [Hirundo rustica rustica]